MEPNTANALPIRVRGVQPGDSNDRFLTHPSNAVPFNQMLRLKASQTVRPQAP